MNQKTRERIWAIRDELETLKTEIETIGNDEQEKFDNMSEGLQQSEKSQAMQSAAEYCEEAVSGLDDVVSVLHNIE
jgi:hypothetical protein